MHTPEMIMLHLFSECWKVMVKHPKFLGLSWDLDEDDSLFMHLQEFTCWPYRVKNETSVNAVRRKMFESKYSNQGKIVDLTLFPPCKPVPHLYCQKTNYVAKL